MSDILLQLVPAVASSLLYAALALQFWHTRWRESVAGNASLRTQPWERAAIFIALAIQGVGLYDGLFGASGMRFSFSFALSLMMWLAALIYWLESFMARMEELRK